MMKVCENCQKLANDVDLWKTKYKEQAEEILDKLTHIKVKGRIVEVTINWDYLNKLKKQKRIKTTKSVDIGR